MPSKIITALLRDERNRYSNQTKRIRGLEKAVAAAEAAILHFHSGIIRTWLGYKNTILLRIPVDTFQDAMPILAFLEDYYGQPFTDSKDWPQYNTRDFHAKGLTVEFELTEKNANCRRVIKQWTRTPVYEFVCSDEAKPQ